MVVGGDQIPGFMQAREEMFPTYVPDGVYPPNTLLVISSLVVPSLRVEIEALAVRAPRRARGGRATSTRSSASKSRKVAKRTSRRR